MKTYWIIWLAISIHLVQGMVLILDPDVGKVNSINFLLNFFPDRNQHILVGIHLIVTAMLATLERILMSYKNPLRMPKLKYLWLLLPEQFILIVASGGAVKTILTGQFTIGVSASTYVAVAAQCPLMFLTIFYCLAITEIYMPERLPWNTSTRILLQ